jgi:hypothetical protein
LPDGMPTEPYPTTQSNVSRAASAFSQARM